jgi:hypothetical protein
MEASTTGKRAAGTVNGKIVRLSESVNVATDDFSVLIGIRSCGDRKSVV